MSRPPLDPRVAAQSSTEIEAQWAAHTAAAAASAAAASAAGSPARPQWQQQPLQPQQPPRPVPPPRRPRGPDPQARSRSPVARGSVAEAEASSANARASSLGAIEEERRRVEAAWMEPRVATQAQEQALRDVRPPSRRAMAFWAGSAHWNPTSQDHRQGFSCFVLPLKKLQAEDRQRKERLHEQELKLWRATQASITCAPACQPSSAWQRRARLPFSSQ